MRSVTDIKGLVGKTIISAEFLCCDEQIVIVFDDNSGCLINPVNGYDGDATIEIDDIASLDPHEQVEGKIISEEEYSSIIEEKIKQDKIKEKERDELHEAMEKSNYERLKAKYE